MRIFKYILEDINKAKLKFIITSIEVIIGCFMFCYLLNSNIQFSKQSSMMKTVIDTQEISMLQDNTSEEHFTELTEYDTYKSKIHKWYTNFWNYIDEKKIDNYVVEETTLCRKNNLEDLENYGFKFIYVTPNFFDVFNIKADFDREKFKTSSKIMPVVLGHDFRGEYKEGDIITDDLDSQYVVIGFLNKDSNYVEPSHNRNLLNMDRTIVAPFNKNKTEYDDELNIGYCMYFLNASKNDLYELIKMSKDMKLLDYSIVDFSHQFKSIKRDNDDKNFLSLFLLLIIGSFCMIGMSGNMIQFISDSKTEFAICMLCGSTKKEIIVRVLMQCVIFVILGLIAPLIIYGVGTVFYCTVLYAVVFVAASVSYPIFILNKQTIKTIMIRSYE